MMIEHLKTLLLEHMTFDDYLPDANDLRHDVATDTEAMKFYQLALLNVRSMLCNKLVLTDQYGRLTN